CGTWYLRRPLKIISSITACDCAMTSETSAAAGQQAVLDKLTSERNRILDEWADPKSLGEEEVALNEYQREHLKCLFGETGFNPPVPPRNPISVSMHNPRFGAALWAINTEAYRRKGTLSRGQKEVIALGVSLSNECPHCAFIHTAMGPASGNDVTFGELRKFYQTRDADVAFPLAGDRQKDHINNKFAAWSMNHRAGNRQSVPCTGEETPEVLGTVMLFDILNRVVDAFVSRTESGPMFPLPVRMMMKAKPMTSAVQRMTSWMMSWLMHGEDAKIEAGKVLREINEITPIIKGFPGAEEAPPLKLPEEFSWAAFGDDGDGGNGTIATAFAFLASEADLLARSFVPPAVRKYTESWVSTWDGRIAPEGALESWLDPAVAASGFDEGKKGDVAMLRLMLVTIVASRSTNDNLLSACQQEIHGFRGTHAAVLWSAFLAARRSCQLAVTGGRRLSE
ncbi:unnamed protein product, partial [Scytosiphon promiscuus]